MPTAAVSAEDIESVIDWISNGGTLREWCRAAGHPSYSSIYRALEVDDDFKQRFARARDEGADAIAEEALAIIDTLAEQVVSDTGRISRDSAHVAWLRNRCEYRLKLLAKWNPKKYGDKLALDGQVEAGAGLLAILSSLAGK